MSTLPTPPRVAPIEMAVLLASTAGVFITSSALWLYWPDPDAGVPMTTGRLAGLVALELVMAAVWLPRLRALGWSHRSVSLSPEPKDVVRGVGVLVASMLAYTMVWTAAAVFWPSGIEAATAVRITGQPAGWAILLVSLVNPVAEEFLYLGLVARALERSSLGLALWAGTGLRVLTHLYQGPFALLFVLPIGLVFAGYYLRSHRLWPVVVAHSLMDVLALLNLQSSGS